MLEINEGTPRETKLRSSNEPFCSDVRKERYRENFRIFSVFLFGIGVGLCPIYVVN